MLPKDLRLPPSVRLSSAKTYSTPFFVMKYSPNAFSHLRLGVVISKKVDKRATVRNTIRRIVHTITHEELEKMQPFDILFIVKPDAGRLSSGDLKEQIYNSYKKTSILSL